MQFENQANDDLIDVWSDKTMAVYVLERRSAVAMAKAIAGPEDPMVARTAAPHRYTTNPCRFRFDSV